MGLIFRPTPISIYRCKFWWVGGNFECTAEREKNEAVQLFCFNRRLQQYRVWRFNKSSVRGRRRLNLKNPAARSVWEVRGEVFAAQRFDEVFTNQEGLQLEFGSIDLTSFWQSSSLTDNFSAQIAIIESVFKLSPDFRVVSLIFEFASLIQIESRLHRHQQKTKFQLVNQQALVVSCFRIQSSWNQIFDQTTF